MPDKIMTEADFDRLHAQLTEARTNTMATWWSTLRTAETTPMPPPDQAPNTGTWSTGVWAEHNLTHAVEWFRWLGRDPAALLPNGQRAHHVTAFVTHAKGEADMRSDWWRGTIPGGAGLSLRVPLVPKNDPNLKTDRTATFRAIAKQAASVDPHALICPGWEMNLPQWASKVTAGNLNDWRAAWTRCYDTMKAECPTLVIGFNPNGGGDQTGIDVRRAIVEGKVDAIGPDQYDCWPGMTTPGNIDVMFDRFGGLEWWASIAHDVYGVPFILPEWGGSIGSQWKGHTSGDNPIFIQEVRAFLVRTAGNGPGVFQESYFNGSYPELRGDIFRTGTGVPSLPRMAEAYRRFWFAQ